MEIFPDQKSVSCTNPGSPFSYIHLISGNGIPFAGGSAQMANEYAIDYSYSPSPLLLCLRTESCGKNQLTAVMNKQQDMKKILL
jgi:hypothetical protein